MLLSLLLTACVSASLVAGKSALFLSKGKKNHAEAEDACSKKGGRLFNPRSEEDQQNWDASGFYWIGIKSKDSGETWAYSDGSQLSEWALNNVRNARDWIGKNVQTKCVDFGWTNYGLIWGLNYCDRQYKYACNITKVCPSGFEMLSGNCYGFFNDGKTWDEAKSSCQTRGAFLAEPKSQEENAFIKDLVVKNDGKSTWLGGTDRQSEGDWVWASNGGEISAFTDWYPLNLINKDQHCLQMWREANYRWDDVQCDVHLHFVCQKPKNNN